MYLGIDLGTSGVKSVLINDDQQLVAQAHAPLPVSRPRPGWSEQLPSDWIAAVEQTLTELQDRQRVAMAAVRAIAVSGQMHGATLLDRHQRVIRPAMLWNDTRSHQQAARLDALPAFHQISGNLVFPGFTAPKVLWVKDHEPHHFRQIDKVLLPKDYLNWWLSGEFIGDYSDASGTAWLDVAGRDWSDTLLGHCELDRRQMPRLGEGNAAAAVLRDELVQRFGLSTKPIIAGGAGDNAASAVGMGVTGEGEAFTSLGTSGVLFAATADCRPNPASAVHTFCHAVADTWHQMGVILSATDALNWLAARLNQTPAALTDALGDKPVVPSELLFLPYLGGERTPHNDAAIRGAFLGLAHETDNAALTRAVLEGVSYALKDNLQALKLAGTDLNRVLAVGGGARSGWWLRLLADVLELDVAVSAEAEVGAAFGAARLAMMAAGAGAVAEICTQPTVSQLYSPDTHRADHHKQQYQRYREAYPLLKAL